MVCRPVVVAALIAIATSYPSRSEPAEGTTLTVDDVVGIESAEGFDISPDGRWAAWSKSTANPQKNNHRQNLYLTRVHDPETIQLTRGDGRDRAPRFSPSGQLLAFLREEGEPSKPQIYLLDLRGGEAEQVTRVANGVVAFDWIDDRSLVFSAREDSTYRERRLRIQKDDAVVVADAEHYAPVRLFVHDLEHKQGRRLTTNPGVVDEFAVSPDGRWVVTSENQDIDYEYNRRNPPRQFLVEVSSGLRREICTAPHVDPHTFKWNALGTGFYCVRDIASDTTSTFVAIERLYYYDLAGATLREVMPAWERGLGGDYFVGADGVVASLADGASNRTAYATIGKQEVTIFETRKSVRLLGAQRNGKRVVYAHSDASSIPEVMAAIIDEGGIRDIVKLIDLNEPLKKRTLSQTAIIRWAGAGGDTVDGILYYPPAYDTSAAYPLVALIHGGPTGVDTDFFTERWSNYPHVLAARGAFVLKVNYHGSGNYGLEWMESIKGRYYELEVPDILAGIDYLVETGLVDENRIGIMGWSNGAILAIVCCLESDRFKALCAGAGDVNWTSDYGNCSFGAGFDDAYFGGAPWESTQVYIDKSPLFRMNEIETPTLILFGAEDRSVPTEQGWQHFRAMQAIGAAPVRFVLFPGAKHGLTALSHQRRKMREELAWFDTHLFGRSPSADEVLDDGSPLALELAKAEVAHVGHLVGVEHDATLLPEVVALSGIRVGRFEVTRAQFAAFDPNYTYEPGTDNLPVTNVSYPLAQTYCMWLSERTGETYRLPSEDEMKRFLAEAKANAEHENTLERWVGYRPTPDELDDIARRVEVVEQRRLLIEPVGSFRPAGGVYDLGGNAAEWVAGPDGKGVIRGFSAVTCADELDGYVRPPLSYVGFRVVRP